MGVKLATTLGDSLGNRVRVRPLAVVKLSMMWSAATTPNTAELTASGIHILRNRWWGGPTANR